MTTETIQPLLDASDRMVEATPSAFHRYLFDMIDWRDRLICIEGARGTGKSTIMRQRMKEGLPAGCKAVYMSFDDLWFAGNPFVDAVQWLYSHGYTHLFLDEVHQMPDWSFRIKNVNDQYPSLSIVYSGSSILRLSKSKGDLSRRQAVYGLKGLSFREYLSLEGLYHGEKIPLGEILADHRKIAAEIVRKVKVLAHFETYLKTGYYPFYSEAFALYGQRIIAAINKTLESDWPFVADVSPATIRKTKKMLMSLAASAPQLPNMAKLYRELETERNTGLKMLEALEKGALLSLVSSSSDKLKNLSRPEKIYCDNTNLMFALTPQAEKGTVRETFFLNQLGVGHDVTYPAKGDFLVDGKHLFEVGGSGKRFTQIKDMPDSYVAADDIEIGIGNKIPLWLFGFLY